MPFNLFTPQWRRAQAKARLLVESKKEGDALQYLANAIRRSTGRLELIEDYCACSALLAERALEEGRPDEASTHLTALGRFLEQQASLVDVNDVGAVIALAKQAGDKKQKLERGRTPKAVPEAADPAGQQPEWQRAQFLARTLAAEGRLEEALHYFANGLRSSSDRMSLIRDYCGCAQAHARQALAGKNLDETLKRLEYLEAFLRAQTTVVSVDEVQELLELAAKTRQTRQEIAESDFDSNDELLDAEGAPGGPATEAEEESEEEQLKRAVDDSIRRVDVALAEAREQPDAVATYQLAAAEALLRPVATSFGKLAPEQRNAVEQRLRDLRSRAELLAKQTREKEASNSWESFRFKWALAIEDVQRRPVADGPGACSLRLYLARRVTQEAASTLSSLIDTEAGAECQKLLRDLQERGELIAKEQVARYNKWALQRIKDGVETGYAAKGVFKPLENVGKAVIDHFGNIDARLLTHEVARCYSESFEFLFAKLDSPPDSKDASDKLFVLKAMFDAKKVSLEEY